MATVRDTPGSDAYGRGLADRGRGRFTNRPYVRCVAFDFRGIPDLFRATPSPTVTQHRGHEYGHISIRIPPSRARPS